jgi:hypothetical protein
MISRRTHGILDYVVGIVLLLAPSLFGFSDSGAASRLPITLGVIGIIYSLLTNYELGLIRVLPFGFHRVLDVLSGLLLALSPWLFGFADQIWVPHVILGLIELGVVAITRSAPTTTGTGIPGAPAHS